MRGEIRRSSWDNHQARPQPITADRFSGPTETAAQRAYYLCGAPSCGSRFLHRNFKIASRVESEISRLSQTERASTMNVGDEQPRFPANRTRRPRRFQALRGAHPRPEVHDGVDTRSSRPRPDRPRGDQANPRTQLLGGRLHEILQVYRSGAGFLLPLI